MTDRISQGVALRLQLAAIAGNEPADGCFWLLTKRGEAPPKQDFIPVGELERAARCVISRSRLGDVFVGCAPRIRPSGRIDAVERVWTLWADCDSDRAIERLRGFQPFPSIVARSGSTLPSGNHRLHAYWPLREPLAPAAAEIANGRLAQALGADTGTHAARVLRPAGSLNYKHRPPVLIQCVRLELDVFIAAHVVEDLCPVELERRQPRSRERIARTSLPATWTCDQSRVPGSCGC